MKIFNLYLFLAVGAFCIGACDNKSEIQEINTTAKIQNQAQDGTTFFALLGDLHLDIRQPEAYTTDALFAMYDRVQHEFATYKYAKAAKAQIIMFLADSTARLKNDQITFLLQELKQFDMAYPKEHFLLLEEAKQRQLLKPEVLQSEGSYAYQKALSKAYIWEYENISPTDPPMEGDSYVAQAYNQNLNRAIYTQKLSKYVVD